MHACIPVLFNMSECRLCFGLSVAFTSVYNLVSSFPMWSTVQQDMVLGNKLSLPCIQDVHCNCKILLISFLFSYPCLSTPVFVSPVLAFCRVSLITAWQCLFHLWFSLVPSLSISHFHLIRLQHIISYCHTTRCYMQSGFTRSRLTSLDSCLAFLQLRYCYAREAIHLGSAASRFVFHFDFKVKILSRVSHSVWVCA